MHPNWRALATVHIPYKRFVVPEPPTTSNQQQLFPKLQSTNNLNQSSDNDGPKTRQIYEEIIKSESKNYNTKLSTKIECKRKKRSEIKIPFDLVKFFQAATTNNVTALESFEYKNNVINSKDMFGWSALMMAACENSIDAFEYLLKNGADLSVSDKKGNTATSLAKSKHFTQIINLIKIYQQPPPTKNLKKKSLKSQTEFEPFYCELCNGEFVETTRRKHQTSTVHQFNMKQGKRNSLRFSISRQNRGLKIMQKQGWDEESGLGPTGTGNLFPVKTIIRKQRTGLGVAQESAKVTHFQAYDLDAIKYHPPARTKSRKDMQREQRRNRRQEKRLRTELA